MILPRKFQVVEGDDYERIAAASGRLRAVLDAVAEDGLPPEYDERVLTIFIRSLLAVQRQDGSFSVSADPDELEPEVRDDAHRFVTWVSAALLCRFEEDYGDRAAVDGLGRGIAAVLRCPVIADFEFPDSGPAELVQTIEAVLILAAGGIPERIRRGSVAAPELDSALTRIASGFRRRADTGETTLPGGVDYRPLILTALAALES